MRTLIFALAIVAAGCTETRTIGAIGADPIDASSVDAPLDAGSDAPLDAVTDAPLDAGTDAPLDAGTQDRPRVDAPRDSAAVDASMVPGTDMCPHLDLSVLSTPWMASWGGNGIAVDCAGNSYVTGAGSTFVSKLNDKGHQLWAVPMGEQGLGGTYSVIGKGIAVDSAGNGYVTGTFGETATFGSTTLTEGGLFVAKLDRNGNWLWAVSADAKGWGIALDSAGNSFVTGDFNETATFGSTTLIGTSNQDAFVAKLDSNGNWLWAASAGAGSTGAYESVLAYGVGVDSWGNSYVGGMLYTTATFGSTTLTSKGQADIFVAKLDSAGNWLWAVSAGGSGYDQAPGIAVDDVGNTYVVGACGDMSTFGSTTLTEGGLLVAKVNNAGTWQWARSVGGADVVSGYGIAVDGAGNSYITGHLRGTATFGSTWLSTNGEDSALVAKLDSAGNWLWALFDKGSPTGQGIAVDSAGNPYATGCWNPPSGFVWGVVK